MDVSKKDKDLSSIMGFTRKDISKWVDKLGTVGGLIILLIFHYPLLSSQYLVTKTSTLS